MKEQMVASLKLEYELGAVIEIFYLIEKLILVMIVRDESYDSKNAM